MSQPPFTPPAPPGRGNHKNQQQTDPSTPSTAAGYTPANQREHPPSTPSSDSRPKLNEAERRTRHSESENKRREKIRSAFTRLSEIVPGMTGQAASEAVVLEAAVEEIRHQQAVKRALKRKVVGEGTMSELQFEKEWNAGAQRAMGMDQGEGYADPAVDGTPDRAIKREKGT